MRLHVGKINLLLYYVPTVSCVIPHDLAVSFKKDAVCGS